MSDPETEFLEIFRDEARERLDRMVDTLLGLESGQPPPDAVDSLFREAHTLKGAAAMLELDGVRTLAHAIEEILEAARAQDGGVPEEAVDPLLRAVDCLRRQIVDGTGDGADLVSELGAVRTRLQTPETSDEITPAAPPTSMDGVHPERQRTIRVPAEKVDRLLDLVGETALHRRRLDHALGNSAVGRQAVADELGTGERLLDDLQDAAVGMRTLPLSSIVGGFPRAVRDVALAEGKEVELATRGTETELDRVILEGLSDPIVHLLRNAVAHGIELPDERERRGKPRGGLVVLSADQRGAVVVITVSDDGAGVPQSLLEDAEKAGSLAEVLARPGFSTAASVSELSGRGVGLDAVKAHVEAVGGSMEASSRPGEGTAFELRLPLTLALLDVLLVERGGHVFGIPLTNVEEGVEVEESLVLEGKTALRVRDRSVPLGDLAGLLRAPTAPLSERAPAVIVATSGRRRALRCDRLLGEEQVVVKSLGPLLSSLPAYLGAAILGDGRVALLLEPGYLVRAEGDDVVRSVAAAEPARAPKVLVVEDSFTVRELQRSILEAAGYRVKTAHDGRDGLNSVTSDEEIDLVVTDVEMPEMDGIELTRAIRAHPQRSSLPIVIVTSRASDEDERLGIEAGADAYMVKRNFEQQALLETVHRLVGR